jgi:hypothetical protein
MDMKAYRQRAGNWPVGGGKHYFEGNVYVDVDGTYKEDMEPLSYIRLKNARYFQPGGNPFPISGGVLWRGQVREIDGFNLDELGNS